MSRRTMRRMCPPGHDEMMKARRHSPALKDEIDV